MDCFIYLSQNKL